MNGMRTKVLDCFPKMLSFDHSQGKGGVSSVKVALLAIMMDKGCSQCDNDSDVIWVWAWVSLKELSSNQWLTNESNFVFPGDICKCLETFLPAMAAS